MLLVAAGYVCGSIPWGVVFTRLAGVDVRQTGSGNIGAANVARSAGLVLGLATLAADAFKGAVPVLVAERAGASVGVAAAAGVAAFAGHVFPITLGFAGGKGVATAAGVLATLAPLSLAAAATVFVVLLAFTSYVSVASVTAAATATTATAWLGYPPEVLAASVVMTLVIFVRHRANYARLWAGNESRFTLRKGQALPPD